MDLKKESKKRIENEHLNSDFRLIIFSFSAPIANNEEVQSF